MDSVRILLPIDNYYGYSSNIGLLDHLNQFEHYRSNEAVVGCYKW